MHPELLKRIVLEIYLATTENMKNGISATMSRVSPPIPHLNVDLWKCKIMHKKCIGMRFYFVDLQWKLQSFLLGVRVFHPSASLSHLIFSDKLLNWCKRVFSEFGFDVNNIRSSTLDAGSDMKRLCTTLLKGEWYFCICQLLNCALVEAFGTTFDPSKS